MTCPIPSKAATRGEIPQEPVQTVSPLQGRGGRVSAVLSGPGQHVPPSRWALSLAGSPGLPDDAEASCHHISTFAIGPRRTQMCESKETGTQRAKQ
jgi:hypothetical protein